MRTNNKVFLISLGCPKNLVDSEHMLGILRSRGFDIESRVEKAGVVVINTCSFIEAAVEETIDTILEITHLKGQGALNKLVVVGCFVQRYGRKLLKEFPEVDGWLGTGEIHRIADIIDNDNLSPSRPFFIGRPTYLADHRVPRIQTTPFFSAYLKIAEGCSHRCSYCIIPSLRGPFRSRGLESLIAEAEELVNRGAKELNLIAQDTTMYGKDLGEGVCLEDLLEKLITIKGVEWLRLLYCHPDGISDRLLDLIDSEEVICPYIDLPLQHVNQGILRDMGRNPGRETPWKLIERIRKKRRMISLRTTLMVGFPGETDKIFDDLYGFVKRVRFDHLGVFIFSAEEGVHAGRLRPMVEHGVAERRRDELVTLQAGISKRKLQQVVGHRLPVLIEGHSDETQMLLKGRTSTMAPDVDAQVLINKGMGVAGEIMPVLITEAHTYDLVGEIGA